MHSPLEEDVFSLDTLMQLGMDVHNNLPSLEDRQKSAPTHPGLSSMSICMNGCIFPLPFCTIMAKTEIIQLIFFETDIGSRNHKLSLILQYLLCLVILGFVVAS